MEKIIKPVSGFFMLIVAIACISIGFYLAVTNNYEGIASPMANVLCSVLLVAGIFLIKGLTVVNPNQATACTFFGKYTGTIKKNGLLFVNPLYKKQRITLRARNFESETIKVNDKLGNPVMIGVISVWRVKDTFKALFEVNNYEKFIQTQTDSAVRKLAASFPYDHFEDEQATTTLSTDFDTINQSLEKEISERLELAGIEVVEARIVHLSYAPEIAHSMLRRQQASAIVAARNKIVEGAVGMVESALNLLSTKNIIELDEEKKAAMVSNLMVVLCGDRETQPVVNTGTLNQ